MDFFLASTFVSLTKLSLFIDHRKDEETLRYKGRDDEKFYNGKSGCYLEFFYVMPMNGSWLKKDTHIFVSGPELRNVSLCPWISAFGYATSHGPGHPSISHPSFICILGHWRWAILRIHCVLGILEIWDNIFTHPGLKMYTFFRESILHPEHTLDLRRFVLLFVHLSGDHRIRRSCRG